MLKLVEPSVKYEEEALAYIMELLKYNSSINGTGSLEKYVLDNKYDEWLELNEKLKKGPVGDYVPASTYFLIENSSNKIIGMVNIRHYLNDFLLNRGGNIGYSVRPLERCKGYGKGLLYLALLECQKLNLSKVLITCDDTNIASFKVIEALGGKLENKISDDDEIVRRYWIDVLDSLNKNKKIYEEVIK